MTEALAELFRVTQDGLLGAALVFLRLGAVMALLPAFGEAMIPARVKLALTIAFTAIVAPAVWPSLDALNNQAWSLWSICFAEVLAGLAIGLSLRLLVFALQIAGTIAAQSTSLSQLFGGQAVDPQPALGAILVLGGIALATIFGLHAKVAVLLIVSYETWPPGQTLGATYVSGWGISAVSGAFRFAAVLAMPFVLSSLLYNLALGVINRAMPQLMVAFVGAPAITFGALVLLALCAPLVLSVWQDTLSDRLTDPFGIR